MEKGKMIPVRDAVLLINNLVNLAARQYAKSETLNDCQKIASINALYYLNELIPDELYSDEEDDK